MTHEFSINIDQKALNSGQLRSSPDKIYEVCEIENDPSAIHGNNDRSRKRDEGSALPCPSRRGSRAHDPRLRMSILSAHKQRQSGYDLPASSRKVWTASNSMRRFFSMMIVWVPSGSIT